MRNLPGGRTSTHPPMTQCIAARVVVGERVTRMVAVIVARASRSIATVLVHRVDTVKPIRPESVTKVIDQSKPHIHTASANT